MKRYFFLIPLFLLASCGGDNNDEQQGQPQSPTNPEEKAPANTNRNDASINSAISNLEFPKIKGDKDNVILTHKVADFGLNYSLEWDHSLRAQRWVCYQLTEKNFPTNGNSRKKLWPNSSPWNYDPLIPTEEQQATYNELSKTYYPGTTDVIFEKGHLCPSADRLFNKEVNEQTFLMTNIMPMVGKFNGGIWNTMESKIRQWLGEVQNPTTYEMVRNWNGFCDSLFICKGGTIDKADQILAYTIESANVNGEATPHPGKHIIPKYFFIALLAKKGESYKALGFWVEHLNENHSKDSLSNYVVNIDELERLTGIDFFCNLPDVIENEVESANVDNIKNDWGLK